jgi:hypothetical protein
MGTLRDGAFTLGAAALGAALALACGGRQEDAAHPARAQRLRSYAPSATVPSEPGRHSDPERVPVPPALGGGIFEQLDDDMVLLVLQHVCLVAAEPETLNAATDAAAAALISASGINKQWRRLGGLRCFWMPLCQHHFGIGSDPVECPRWCDEQGAVSPPLQVHEAESSNSYYEALGVEEGATAQEIAAAYAKAIRDVVVMSTGTDDLAVEHAEDAAWRKCWLSWHAEAATQIGHTHMPLQRRPGSVEHMQPLVQAANRPISGHTWCRVVDCWRRIHEFCAFVSHPDL